MASKERSASLTSYLADHLGGAESAVAVLRRMQAHFAGQSLGEFLGQLLSDIEEDQQTLLDLAQRISGTSGSIKRIGGWLGEKASRLRLPLTAGSERFSAFEALELLAVGVLGKRSLWTAPWGTAHSPWPTAIAAWWTPLASASSSAIE